MWRELGYDEDTASSSGREAEPGKREPWRESLGQEEGPGATSEGSGSLAAWEGALGGYLSNTVHSRPMVR